MQDIPTHWKILSGEKDWEGLLDPINNDLRLYLDQYGGLAGAAGDSLNSEKESAGYGLCRYPPEVFFTRVGLQNGNPFNYRVTHYIYARAALHIFSPPEMPVYIGFVAVSTDRGKVALGRRDIIVCWRGTLLPADINEDINIIPVSAADIFPNSEAAVHGGFHDLYTTKSEESKYNKMSAREQVLAAVRRAVDKCYADYPNEELSITVVGHSLGAALATLNAMDIVANGFNKPTGSTVECPVACFAFASPRVGNQGFLDEYSKRKKNLHILRITNAHDIVPMVPWLLDYYKHVGVELNIDTSISPYVREVPENQKSKKSHDLNLYRHGIAGYQGKDFTLAIDFDLALVNKYDDLLRDGCKVPPIWSNVHNKGMVQMDDGFWKLHDYIPDPPTDDASDENGTA